MSNNDLVVDLNPVGILPYYFGFDFKEGTGIDITAWDFSEEFGVLEKHILKQIGDSFTVALKKEAPVSLDIPQLSFYAPEPELPLEIKIGFGLGADNDQMYFTHSLDKIVAIDLDCNRNRDGTYSGEFVARATKFRDALRELADKMDIELKKVTTK
jgi:hypothetical protein